MRTAFRTRHPLVLLAAVFTLTLAGPLARADKNPPPGPAPEAKKPAPDKDDKGDKGASGASIFFQWHLITASIRGGMNNGYGITCQEAKIKTLVLTIKSESSGKITTVEVPCTADLSVGTIEDFKLPADKGPFTFTASVKGMPKVRSERVRGVGKDASVNLRVYAQGCDEVCDR